jgi:hypothetical protein
VVKQINADKLKYVDPSVREAQAGMQVGRGVTRCCRCQGAGLYVGERGWGGAPGLGGTAKATEL